MYVSTSIGSIDVRAYNFTVLPKSAIYENIFRKEHYTRWKIYIPV